MHSRSSLWCFFGCSGIQSFASCLVEQMHERRVGLQPDLVARIELMTLAEHGNDLLAPVVRDGEVLGPDAVYRGPAFRIGGRRGQRKFHAVRTFKAGTSVRLHFA